MLVPHVAAGLGVPPGTDHGGLHIATPPVAAATDAVLHQGQQGLLQALGHRAMGCNTRWPPPPAVSHLGATGHSLGRGHSLVPYISFTISGFVAYVICANLDPVTVHYLVAIMHHQISIHLQVFHHWHMSHDAQRFPQPYRKQSLTRL